MPLRPSPANKHKNTHARAQSFVASHSGKVIARAETLADLTADERVRMLLPSKDVVISHDTPEGLTVAYRSSVSV